MKKWLLLLLLLPIYASAQFSKTHYLPPLSSPESLNAEEIYLYISTPNPTWVDVRINRLGQAPLDVQVARDYPYILNLGGFSTSPMMVSSNNAAQVVSNKGIVVEAEDMVYAAVRLIGGQSNHAGELVSKGMAALGQDFRIGTMTNTLMSEYSSTHYSFATIFATENNTKVQISDVKPGARLFNNQLQNGPFEINLNSGESYILATAGTYNANRDALIGARVQSDKPVVVNCGSFGGTNGEMRNMDLGFDQIVPVERTGTDYIFIKNTGTVEVEKIILIGTEDNTEIFLSGNATPTFSIDAGDYVTFNGNDFTPNGNLYVRTSKNVYAFQGIGDNIREDQANQEMFFVPPLSCETPHTINNIPEIEYVGSRVFTARITLVTETGSDLTFMVNGNDYTLAQLTNLNADVQGPISVLGNPDFETYSISGLRGNVGVSSTTQLYLASYGSSEAATFGGYFSGFTFKPEIVLQPLDTNIANCLPNVRLSVNELSGFDTYQWYFNDMAISGATQSSYLPTNPGYYSVKAALSNCTTEMTSSAIAVSLCPEDQDQDQVPDNIDLDFDNDFISNCTESYGDQPFNLAQLSTGTIQHQSYSNTFTAQIVPSTSNTSTSLLSSFNTGIITTRVSASQRGSTLLNFNFAQPISLKVAYPNQAVTEMLNTHTEYIIRVPFNKTITVLNPNDELLIDTNSDGAFENGVRQFSSFEIRFRLNPTAQITPTNTVFSLRTHAVNQLSIQHINLSENQADASSLQLTLTCLPYDTDGDGISNQWDLDSDQDGIPDFIEARGNTELISWIDDNHNGHHDAFETLVPVDSDGDSIPDYLDLDSDNNGIYDCLESGLPITDANSDGRIEGNFGSNGFLNSLETSADSGILIQNIDENINAMPFYIHLDNDLDGCFDVIENRLTDANNDGRLGDANPILVDANGLVLGFGGYNGMHADVNLAGIIELLSQPTEVTTCEKTNTQLTISTSAGVQITWEYQNVGAAYTNVPNSAAFTGWNSNSLQIIRPDVNWDNTIFRAKLTISVNSCPVYSDPIVLRVIPSPTVISETLVQCQPNPSSPNRALFNLEHAKTLFQNASSTWNISYFLSEADAIAQNNTLPLTYQNTIQNQLIWVRVSDANSGCYSISQLTLQVDSQPIITLPNLEQCQDPALENGFGTFDLTQPLSTLSVPLTYYSNLNDALLETDAIVSPTNYQYQENPVRTTIYVRENLGLDCVQLYSFDLMVRPIPEFLPTNNLYYICVDEPAQSVLLEANIISPIGLTYSWTKDGALLTNASNSLNTQNPGTYEVTATNSFGCSATQSFEVLPSSQAVIDELIIADLRDDNSVEIVLQPQSLGDYEFGLNDAYHFQSSGVFQNIAPGIHEITIRDKNGCRPLTTTIHVLGAPKYFTPNADGFNDTWNLKGAVAGLHDYIRIHIYDRFGKLIKEIAPIGDGWDGTYQGNPAPSTDYWYKIETPEGRIAKGHFSLKR